ncbi:MAG: hypothetical protein LQ344_003603 [Seirophora lacunosa]|nr:MAG: hypothetical protein LQ344_003603 [Seirophora lacunosa]
MNSIPNIPQANLSYLSSTTSQPFVGKLIRPPSQTMPIAMSPSPPPTRPRILFLGDGIQYSPDIYKRLQSHFDFVHPTKDDRHRPAFLHHLREGTWGDFQAIMRPSWHSGGEMGKWDEELIGLLPHGVRVSASAGAGYDWVDVGCLADHGILYCNGASASTEAVGDMALYYIISVFRQTTASLLAARSLSRSQFYAAHHNLPAVSRNPRSHTLGIVGLGNIGMCTARKAYAAFGMKIVYHDILRKSPELEASVGATFYTSVDEMLPHTDCLLLATPSDFSGRPFLTADVIALLPRGARFVNVARGSLVDEEALADALESGHLSAAGLDVHAAEPSVSERLARMPNVTMTCHTGGGTVETRVGFEQLAMENVERVLRGEEPVSAVNAHLMGRQQAGSVYGDGTTHGTNGTG